MIGALSFPIQFCKTLSLRRQPTVYLTTMAKPGDNGIFGKRQRTLLPHMVDQIATTDPDAVYGMWPVVPTSYEAGFRSVTYSQLSNIVNGLAWWLIENLGGLGRDNEFVAYVGPNDVRIPALGFATVKAGYAVSKPLALPLRDGTYVSEEQ